jgi:hypothetical protein
MLGNSITKASVKNEKAVARKSFFIKTHLQMIVLGAVSGDENAKQFTTPVIG